jgi:hypothetical protein
MGFHSNVPIGQRHGIHNWEFVNAAAKSALTDFTVLDIGKIAWQLDDNSFWILAEIDPAIVWKLCIGSTFDTQVMAPASDSAAASIRIPHGTAPTAPVDGDMWTTIAGLYIQINGLTVGPLS